MISRGSFVRKLGYIFSFIFVLNFILYTPQAAEGYHQSEIDRLREQQAELKRQQEQNQALLNQKAREAGNLEYAINGLDNDIAYTNNRISNTEDQIHTTNDLIAALNGSIEENTAVLDELNNKLKNAYITLYELSQTSTLELVLQSNSLEDIVSQTQYIQAIQTDLNNDIKKANELQADLTSKKKAADEEKKSLEELNNDLADSRSYLSSQRAQKDDLLEQTEGEQAKYEQILADIRKRNAEVEAQIIATINDLYNSGIGPGEGQPVTKGTPVGIQGSTGFSTGDHVHFEVRQNNVPQNPHLYIGGSMSWPLKSFWISQDFWEYNCWYSGCRHTGIDMVGPKNSTVYAPADGTVILNQCYGAYGRAWVQITDSGQWVLMGHMKGNC